MKRYICLLVTLSALYSVPANAANYYVSAASGSDSNSCATAQSTTQTNQKLTITAGVACLNAGDTLFIHGGTYTGDNGNRIFEVDFTHTATSWAAPITITGVTGETVILTVPNDGDNAVRFQDSSISYVVIQDIILDGTGGYITGNCGAPVATGTTSNHIRMNRVEVKNAAGNGLTIAGLSHEFLNMSVHDNGTCSGYTISNGLYTTMNNGLISGGTFYNNECAGVRVFNSLALPASADNNIVNGVRAYNNGNTVGTCASIGAGIILGDTSNWAYNNLAYNNVYGIVVFSGSKVAHTIHVLNNSAYGNTVGYEIVSGAQNTEFKNNISYNNSGNYTNNGTATDAATNLIGTNPLFVNAASANFALSTGSPAIDAGTTLTSVATDFNGAARPRGSLYDIGAIEFGSTTTPSPSGTRVPPASSFVDNSDVSWTFGGYVTGSSGNKWILQNGVNLDYGNGTELLWFEDTAYAYASGAWYYWDGTHFQYYGTDDPAGTIVAPTIVTHPLSQSIPTGTTASLSVTASGTAPLTYQWYVGVTGNTASPIALATSSTYTTPTLTTTQSYWVRVTNAGGSANTNTAVISISVPPSIVTHPTSRSIVSGNTTTLSVTASGTAPLTYQWYIGTSGVTTTPVTGATANIYVTSVLTATTSYWVRVSNGIGTTDSNTAIVTVTSAPTAPTIVTQPSSQTVTNGSTATLSVVASSSATAPLSYQWYVGTSGTTTTPIGGATSSAYTTAVLSATTTRWVRVTNSVGSVDSNTATLTVTFPATITSQPTATQTVFVGATATLSASASGTAPITYQWYNGLSPITTSPISGATSSSYTTPALSAGTTNYWMRATNALGVANTITASVTAIVSSPPATPTVVTVTDRVVMKNGGCVERSGFGSPEGVITGKICDTWHRIEHGTTYEKRDGSGNVGWVTSSAANQPSYIVERDTLGGFSMGALDATTGTFAGNVAAASGTFAGTVNALDGVFGNSIVAGTGTFTSLVSGRIPYATTAGLLIDNPTFYFTPSTSTVNVSTAAATVAMITPRSCSPNYFSQATGWCVDQLGAADFRYLYADQLHVRSFIADLEQALAGSEIIVKSVTSLGAPFTVPAASGSATIVVKDLPSAANMAVFESGDTIRLRGFARGGGGLFVDDAWGTVSSYTDQLNGVQTWNFNRDTTCGGAMTAGRIINADSIVLDYGVSGNGGIESNAIDGIYGVNSPYIQVFKWMGSSPCPANLSIVTRIGNLRGITGVADEYGALFGTWSAVGGQWAKISSQGADFHGIDISQYNVANDKVFFLDHAIPSMAMGSVAPTEFGSAGGVGMWQGIESGCYKWRIGDMSGDYIAFNECTGVVTVNGSIVVTGTPGDASSVNGYSGSSVVSASQRVLGNGSTIPASIDSFGLPTLPHVANTGSTAGLFLGSNYLGFFNGTSWGAYIAANGDFALNGAGGIFAFTAATGTANVGGWTLNSVGLIKDTGTAATSMGMVPADRPFYAGATYANRATAPFNVTPAGLMTASDAVISGSFTAGALTIDDTNGMKFGIPPASRNKLYGLYFLTAMSGTNFTGVFGFEASNTDRSVELQNRTDMGPGFITRTFTSASNQSWQSIIRNYATGTETTTQMQLSAPGGILMELAPAANGVLPGVAASAHEFYVYQGTTRLQTGTDGVLTIDYTTAAGAGANTHINFLRAGVSQGSVVCNSGCTYTTVSDSREKNDLGPTKYGLKELMKLNVRDYTMRNDIKAIEHTGLMAQQVMTIFSEPVSLEPISGKYQIDYSRFTPLLLRSAQEMQDEIVALTKRIEQLEKK